MNFWYKVDVKDQSIIIDYKRNFEPLPFIEAARITVENIIKNFPDPYYIMLSGGLDSQAMLYAWQRFGKNFIATTVRYCNDLNSHDIIYALKYTRELGIKIELIDFDILSFYNEQYNETASLYQCSSPHFACHIAMTSNLKGTVVFSGDRLHRKLGSIWQANFCLYNYAQSNSVIPYFFIQTPEIAYSEIYGLDRHKLLYTTLESEHMIKYLVYNEEKFSVILPPKKYTGFEKVKEYFDNECYTQPCLTRLKYSNRPSKRNFDLIYRYPYEKKYGFKKIISLIN